MNLCSPAIVEDPAFARILAIQATLELYGGPISFSPAKTCKVDIFVIVEVSNCVKGIGMRSSTPEVIRFRNSVGMLSSEDGARVINEAEHSL